MVKSKGALSISEKVDGVFRMAKNLIYLDRTEWLADIVSNEFCPKCNYEKSNYLLPDFYPPYIYCMPRLGYTPESNFSYVAAQNIMKILTECEKLPAPPKNKKRKLLVLVDFRQFDFVDLAKQFYSFSIQSY